MSKKHCVLKLANLIIFLKFDLLYNCKKEYYRKDKTTRFLLCLFPVEIAKNKIHRKGEIIKL